MTDTHITIVGNLVEDPSLSFTPSGAPVCNFRVASTPRVFNKQSNQWEDGEAMFLTCNVWRQMAENAAETLAKGMRVIVQGRLKARSFQNREGENRTVFEIDVEEVGPSLRYASAQVARNPREGGGDKVGTTQQSQPAQAQGNQWGNQSPQAAAWDKPAAQPAQPAGRAGDTDDSPPF